MAIAKEVEIELGNRQGQRTDLEPCKNFAGVNEKRTDEIAAEKTGFGNETTYRQAKKVVDEGTPELKPCEFFISKSCK